MNRNPADLKLALAISMVAAHNEDVMGKTMMTGMVLSLMGERHREANEALLLAHDALEAANKAFQTAVELIGGVNFETSPEDEIREFTRLLKAERDGVKKPAADVMSVEELNRLFNGGTH